MSDPETPNRRTVLGLIGGAAFAGCSGLPSPFGGEREVVLDGAALRSLAAGEGPVVPERLPVEIADERVDASRNRVRELLETVPLPFDRTEIPNGAIRVELTGAAEMARDELETAAAAPSPFEALGALRDARMRAGRVAGGWRYVADGLRREDLRDDADRLGGEVAAFRREWDYVGPSDAPVRSVLVHASVESLVGTAAGGAALGDGDSPYEWRSNPVSVGELVGDLERSRGALADGRHVYGRYVESLDARRSLRSRFEAAGTELLAVIGNRTDDLPGSEAGPADAVDGLSEGSPGWIALEGLLDDVRFRRPLTEPRRDGDAATVVVRAHHRLARVGGAAALLATLREGTRFTPEAAADVRELREAALAALDSAVQEAPHPALAREAVADLAGRVRYADRELARVDEEVPPSRLARDIAEYVTVRDVARALPEAGSIVADALRGGIDAGGG